MPDQTVEDLGKLVKAKYPAYASMSDADVGKKVKAKYPQYASFKDMPEKPAAPEPSFGEKAEQFGIGAAKGLGQTVRGFNKFASFGLSEVAAGPENRKKYDDLLQTKNKYQSYGKTAENVAEGFVPIPGLSEIKAARGAGMLAKVGVAAGREALDVGMRNAAQTGSLKEGAAGSAFGGALGAAVPLLGHVLETGAKSQYGKILHPSGRAAQEITEAKLLPKSGQGVKGVGSLLEQKGVMGTSRPALATKFAARTAQATDEMNRTYSALGKNAQVNLKPVLYDLAKFIKDKTMLPNGNIADQRLYQTALNIGNDLIRKTGGSIDHASLQDVRKFRQIIDDQLFAKKLEINPETAEDRVQQALRGSIQDVIHSQHPTTAAVDARVHFWKTASTLMKRARPPAERGGSRTLQVGLRAALGGVAGEEYGRRTGGAEQAIEYGFLGAAAAETLNKAFASVAWNSVSAVTKTRIAKLLASGNGQKAADIAARVTGTAAAKATTTP